MVRAFAEEGLKGLGYKVWAAENGQQALEIYERRGQENRLCSAGLDHAGDERP